MYSQTLFKHSLLSAYIVIDADITEYRQWLLTSAIGSYTGCYETLLELTVMKFAVGI